MLRSSIIALLLSWIRVAAESCESSYSQDNFKLQGHVHATHPQSTRRQCTQRCASHKACYSINYYQRQSICELNNANHLSNPESLTFSSDSEYVNYNKRPPARCSNKLCSAGLECVISGKDGQSYKCLSCPGAIDAGAGVLYFPRQSSTDYVAYEPQFARVTAITVSVWVQAHERVSHEMTAYTYAVVDSKGILVDAGHIGVYLQTTQTELYFNRLRLSQKQTFMDGQWHHLCVTWDNVSGKAKLYVDGIVIMEDTTGIGTVFGKGAFVLGQDQDSYKGGFNWRQSFTGNLTNFNMWDRAMTAAEVSALVKHCSSGEGNVIKWADVRDKAVGDVQLI